MEDKMALLKCTECGKEVSENAEKCPNCGNSIRLESKKLSPTTIPLIIIGGILFALGMVESSILSIFGLLIILIAAVTNKK